MLAWFYLFLMSKKFDIFYFLFEPNNCYLNVLSELKIFLWCCKNGMGEGSDVVMLIWWCDGVTSKESSNTPWSEYQKKLVASSCL